MSYLLCFPNPSQDSYYQRYTIKGPKFTFLPKEAYHFPTKDHAANVLGGDERLKGGVVMEVSDAKSI